MVGRLARDAARVNQSNGSLWSGVGMSNSTAYTALESFAWDELNRLGYAQSGKVINIQQVSSSEPMIRISWWGSILGYITSQGWERTPPHRKELSI
jgi:hypothetical protein